MQAIIITIILMGNKKYISSQINSVTFYDIRDFFIASTFFSFNMVGRAHKCWYWNKWEQKLKGRKKLAVFEIWQSYACGYKSVRVKRGVQNKIKCILFINSDKRVLKSDSIFFHHVSR